MKKRRKRVSAVPNSIQRYLRYFDERNRRSIPLELKAMFRDPRLPVSEQFRDAFEWSFSVLFGSDNDVAEVTHRMVSKMTPKISKRPRRKRQ